jgi:hypothetical protein
LEDQKFKAELPLVMSKGLKVAWNDSKGKQLIMERLSQATFSVESRDYGVVASKRDPVRSYCFLFTADTMTFTMELDSRLTENPHRWFLETLFGELNMLQSWAQEFITEKTTYTQTVPLTAQKYVE